MFGNPQWFRAKAIGFGLIPIRCQGWAYSAAWVAAIGMPYWLLTARHQSLEALAWLTLATGTLAHDVWKIRVALRQPQQARPAGDLRGVRLSCRVAD